MLLQAGGQEGDDSVFAVLAEDLALLFVEVQPLRLSQ
jgi:hypothetical protein